MSERKSYVVKREKELVIRSSIIGDPAYTNLKDMLLKYDRIDDYIIAEDGGFTAATVNIIKNTFPSIVQNAVSEWEYFMNRPAKSRCMLDNRDIKTEYFIRSKMTGEELVVGSECIRKFDFHNSVSGVPMSTFVQRQQNEQRKIARANDISESYGNIANILFRHRKRLEDAPFILPWEIYTAYLCNIDAIEVFQSEYVSGKLPQYSLKNLGDILTETNEFADIQVDGWLKEHTNNFFMGTVQDADFLRRTGKLGVLQTIRKNGGRITQETVGYIGHLDYIRKNLSAFNKKLASVFKRIDITADMLCVYFRDESISVIRYTMPPEVFMATFGFVLFERDIVEFNFEAVYPKCQLEPSAENAQVLLAAIRRVMTEKITFNWSRQNGRLVIRRGDQICDTLTITSLVTYLVPRIVAMKNADDIAHQYFDMLNWKLAV